MPERDVRDRALQALDGITEGSWVQVGFGNIHAEPVGSKPPVAKTWNRRNGEFIAAAPQLVRELVAEVEHLRANQRHEELEAHLGKAKGIN